MFDTGAQMRSPMYTLAMGPATGSGPRASNERSVGVARTASGHGSACNLKDRPTSHTAASRVAIVSETDRH